MGKSKYKAGDLDIPSGIGELPVYNFFEGTNNSNNNQDNSSLSQKEMYFKKKKEIESKLEDIEYSQKLEKLKQIDSEIEKFKPTSLLSLVINGFNNLINLVFKKG